MTAFQHLRFIENMITEDAWEEKYLDAEGEYSSLDTVCFTSEQPHPERLAPLHVPPQGFAVYEVIGEAWGCRIGAYSYYNAWRNRLSLLANQTPAQQIWQMCHLVTVRDLPFYTLIDFSDCEGAIGPHAARTLAADFRTFQSTIETQTDADFRGLYDNFRKAFELAAEDGAVLFS